MSPTIASVLNLSKLNSCRSRNLPKLLAFAILCVVGVLPLQGQSHENWSGWSALDGQTLSTSPAVARSGGGRLEVFIRNAAGQLYHRSQDAAGSDTWSGWDNLEQGFFGNPVVIADRSERLWVFVQGPSGVVYYKYQISPGGGWGTWRTFDGATNADPAVGMDLQGRLYVFVRGTNNLLYYKAQQSEGTNAQWSSWQNLGGILTSKPAIVLNNEGRFEVYVRGTDNALHYRAQLPGGWWTGWIPLYGVVQSTPAVAKTPSGVDVVVQGSGGTLSHITRTLDGWGPWSGLDSPVATSDPTLGVNTDGRLEIFVRGSDGNIYHSYQSVADGGYGGFNSLGGNPAADSSIAVGVNLDGRLEIFVRTTGSSLDHKAQANEGG